LLRKRPALRDDRRVIPVYPAEPAAYGRAVRRSTPSSCAILWGLATSAAHCARRRGSGRVWQDRSTPSEAKISSRRRIAFGQITCVNINRTTTTSGTPSNQSMIGIATSRLLIRQHRLAKQLVRGSEVPGPACARDADLFRTMPARACFDSAEAVMLARNSAFYWPRGPSPQRTRQLPHIIWPH
jgi:hypothetical protein